MLRLSNATWGNPLMDAVTEVTRLTQNNPDIHVSTQRPTSQQPHKKFEIVIVEDFFNIGSDLALREYQFTLDVYTSGDYAEHQDILIFLSDILTNYDGDLFNWIDVENIIPYDNAVGDLAFNSGISALFMRSAKNIT